jgi:hypothetical protein
MVATPGFPSPLALKLRNEPPLRFIRVIRAIRGQDPVPIRAHSRLFAVQESDPLPCAPCGLWAKSPPASAVMALPVNKRTAACHPGMDGPATAGFWTSSESASAGQFILGAHQPPPAHLRPSAPSADGLCLNRRIPTRCDFEIANYQTDSGSLADLALSVKPERRSTNGRVLDNRRWKSSTCIFPTQRPLRIGVYWR